MAGVLESLSLGLRGAGGVLSKGAFDAIAQEDLQTAQQKRQEALMQLQEQMAQVKEAALAQAVGPSLAKGNFEEAAAAAAKSGAPGGTKLALDLLSKAEERKSREAVAKEAREARAMEVFARLDQAARDSETRFGLMKASLTRQEDRDRAEAEYKSVMAGIAQQRANADEYFRRLGLDIKGLQVDQLKQGKLDQKVQQLGTAVEKAGLSEANAVLSNVESLLSQKPELKEWISGPKAAVPDVLAPAEVRDARQAFNKLFNITLKTRSGAAVTKQELDRLKSEFGVGVTKNPDQVDSAISQARTILNKHYGAVASSFGPDVLSAYNDNIRRVGGRVVLEPAKGSDSGGGSDDDPLGLRK